MEKKNSSNLQEVIQKYLQESRKEMQPVKEIFVVKKDEKTMLISEMNNLLNTEDNYVCVSRPRRFGKTMAANMIAAYYSKGCDSHDAFKGLNIESDPSFEEHINKYNVLKIDCGGIYYNKIKGRSFVDELISLIIPEFRKQFAST